MSGPWYESQCPSTNDIKEILIKYYNSNNNNKTDEETIKKYINIVIDKELAKMENQDESTSWGSYRGYYTFTHSIMISNIKKLINND
jgi:protein tyrosine/serine phosphatase